MALKVVIACGGTGGHLFPGIAVAQVLNARGHQTLLLISEKEIDSIAASDHPELHFEKVPAIGMPPLLSPKVVPFAFRFWKTLRKTKKIVRDFGAHAVLGMGGFTSLPPALAGRSIGALTLIHESNAVPGKANRLTARFCDVVLLGLEACATHFPGRQCQVVGTPLRSSMRQPVDRAEAHAFFGLQPDRPTLLVMGGSQGAQGVNRAIVDALPRIDPSALQLIHLTGRDDEATVRDAIARSGHRAFVAAFSARLDLAYAIADLCVARSGASSLAELSHFGVPSILIPYPAAADDHQTRNAEVFTEKGAALLIRQADLPSGALADIVVDLLNNTGRLQTLRSAMTAAGIPDAAERIASLIEHQARA